MKSLCAMLMTAAVLVVGSAATARAQTPGVHSAAAPIQVWNHTSQGMSTNAALAFYRLQNVGRPASQPAAWPLYSRNRAVVDRSAGPPAANTYYPAANTAADPSQKPFASVHPPRTTLERYWPFLFEAYEDPHTGLIIWRLP